MEQHRWYIYGIDNQLLAIIDATKVEKWRETSVSVYHNGAGIAVYFPSPVIKIIKEF